MAPGTSYLNVGQQLLLPPPNVLQLLTLLCSQVTGNYTKGENVRRKFSSPQKASKIQRPLDTSEEEQLGRGAEPGKEHLPCLGLRQGARGKPGWAQGQTGAG